ncbi:MAG: hypothetical protein J1F16_03625 [Muribaculaceae bacterium]|nr:hypothetical protein [Muribaculaceae bacterium]
MIIPNNIPIGKCRDARLVRPLIIKDLALFYFGRTSHASLRLRAIY